MRHCRQLLAALSPLAAICTDVECVWWDQAELGPYDVQDTCGSKSAKRCSAHYSESSCSADTETCVWNAQYGTCQLKALFPDYEDIRQCLSAISECSFDENGNPADESQCAALCAETTSCKWHNSGECSQPECAEYSTEIACTLAKCNWEAKFNCNHPPGDACADIMDEATCDGAPRCKWSSDSCNGVCDWYTNQMYNAHMYDPAECLYLGCVVESTAACEDSFCSGVGVREHTCAANSQCTWTPQVSAESCKPAGLVEAQSQLDFCRAKPRQDCPGGLAHVNRDFDLSQVECVLGTSGCLPSDLAECWQMDNVSCATSAACGKMPSWGSDVCYTKRLLNTEECSLMCYGAGAKVHEDGRIDYDTELTTTACEAKCNDNPNCEWDSSGSCEQTNCHHFDTAESCETASCAWVPTAGTCGTPPYMCEGSDEASCVASHDACQWDSEWGGCYSLCVFAVRNQTSKTFCESLGCLFHPSHPCELAEDGPCDGIDNAQDCVAHMHCEWFSDARSWDCHAKGNLLAYAEVDHCVTKTQESCKHGAEGQSPSEPSSTGKDAEKDTMAAGVGEQQRIWSVLVGYVWMAANVT